MTTMNDDLISRQDAINTIEVTSFDDYGDYMRTRELIEELPSAEPDKRLEKIADLVDGTIDHFDRDDAMDLLYQIKEVLNER